MSSGSIFIVGLIDLAFETAMVSKVRVFVLVFSSFLRLRHSVFILWVDETLFHFIFSLVL